MIRLTSSRRGRLNAAVATLLMAALVSPVAAMAHAELVEASPKAGETVEGTPAEVSGTYTQRLTAASRIELRDPSGTTIATGGRDSADRTRLVLVPPDLAPGEYQVRWTAISAVDSHPERGTWRFTVVAPPTPAPTPVPTAVPSGAPSPSPILTPAPTVSPPTPSPTPTATDGDPTAFPGDVVLPILAALVFVVILGAFLFGRRGRGDASA
jgi:methionine-rich copper-binding protein CopC